MRVAGYVPMVVVWRSDTSQSVLASRAVRNASADGAGTVPAAAHESAGTLTPRSVRMATALSSEAGGPVTMPLLYPDHPEGIVTVQASGSGGNNGAVKVPGPLESAPRTGTGVGVGATVGVGVGATTPPWSRPPAMRTEPAASATRSAAPMSTSLSGVFMTGNLQGWRRHAGRWG